MLSVVVVHLVVTAVLALVLGLVVSAQGLVRLVRGSADPARASSPVDPVAATPTRASAEVHAAA